MDEKIQAYLKLMNENGFNFNEASAVINEELTYAEVISNKELRSRASELQEQPQSKWPTPLVGWDVERARWCLSMDDHDQQSFEAKFPDVEIMWIGTNYLLAELNHFSHSSSELFSKVHQKKIAELVVHLERGGKVSPPMVLFESGKFHVVGGNHRLRWAAYCKQQEIPVLFRGQDRKQIETLLLR